MFRILRKKGGYILAWVVCIFLVVAILSSVAVTVSITTIQSTKSQHNQQQVYYTAKSVAGSMVEYIKANAENTQLIDSLTSNQGRGSIPNMGDYTVDVKYVSPRKMKITVTADFRGESDTVSVYLIQPPAPSGILPTDNVLYLNGDSSGIGQCILNGNLYIDGNFSLSQGSKINGFAVVKGATTMSGAGSTTAGLFSYGNVNLLAGSSVSGDIYTKGDLKMNGNATVHGSVYADGSLDMLNGQINKNAVLGKNAYFAGGANLMGSLLYTGDLSTGWGSVSNFVFGSVTKTSDYTPIEDGPYSAPALPIIRPPTYAEMPELYSPVVINNKTISKSGKITSAVVSQLNQMQWGSIITIDATAGDINLLLENTALNLSNGIDIEVISDGTHNVFIYMTGSSSISVNSNEYIGMDVRSSSPRLYIIGDGEQTISLNNNSELDACVYMPLGTISASGSPLETYKFVGSCIVKHANITSNVMFHYSKPDIDSTPLDRLQSDSGQGAWVIESWDNK